MDQVGIYKMALIMYQAMIAYVASSTSGQPALSKTSPQHHGPALSLHSAC